MPGSGTRRTIFSPRSPSGQDRQGFQQKYEFTPFLTVVLAILATWRSWRESSHRMPQQNKSLYKKLPGFSFYMLEQQAHPGFIGHATHTILKRILFKDYTPEGLPAQGTGMKEL
jgi:hypothetical protein